MTQNLEEFQRQFGIKILARSRRTVKSRIPAVPWNHVEKYENLYLEIPTENWVTLEISEPALAELSRWYEYMDRNFSPEPRDFFHRWWTIEREAAALRSQHPAVQAAWEQYQTMLTLSINNPSDLKLLDTDI
jgi:hypothetical protein